MCGISGFQVNCSLGNQKQNIRKITEKIFHRGPDSRAYWCSEKENVFLGHSRLSIIDLSANASQPMQSYDKRYVITFNGEIYNYKQLIKKYSLKIKEKNIKSDTRLLLELISIFGLEKTLNKVDGMFAFCLWDREEKKFFLIRDRFGEKPLFYFLNKNNFIFGSEIKVITEFFNPSKVEVDNDSFNYFFSLGYIPAPKTIYKNLYKVLPSEILTIKDFKVQKRQKYWKKNALSNNKSSSITSVEKAIEKSVEKMMVADVEVGCFLSGGIDSSLVASIMQKKSERKIKTFSVGFKEKEFDESTYAKKIANYLSTDHHELILSIDEMLNRISEIPKIYDEPFGDSSCLPTLVLSEFASKHVKVALSGDGGDEVFLGYNRYKFAKNFESLIFSKSYYRKKILYNLINFFPPFFYDLISKPFSKAFGLQAFSHKMQKIMNIIDSKDYSDFYCRLNLVDNRFLNFLESNLDRFENEIAKKDFVEVIQYFDLEYYLPNDILVKVDRASMKSSLEVRSPFLDHKLYEQVSKITVEEKMKKNSLKCILKNNLKNYLPEKLFNRPKMGFAIPLSDWINDSKIKEQVNNVIYNCDWEKCNIEKQEIINYWERYKKYKFCTASVIWNFYMVGLWINEKA